MQSDHVIDEAREDTAERKRRIVERNMIVNGVADECARNVR